MQCMCTCIYTVLLALHTETGILSCLFHYLFSK